MNRTGPVKAFLFLCVLAGALLLAAGEAAAIEADTQRNGAFSLARESVHRNHPTFLTGTAPYREPYSPRLKGAESQAVSEVHYDLEDRRVVVTLYRDDVPLVYPWVASTADYIAELRVWARKGGVFESGKSVRGRAAGAAGSSHFNIDIPVRFPKTLGRIIGQGANIQVSGSESITFSGETQYFIKDRDNESGGQRKFPELDMRQQLNINLTGTIGEKVKVEVAHNSESQVPLENRIKLRYEGFEDEVIQKIEVGNTNLSLPGNQFVSFSSNQQGLFGVKVLGKAGKLDFTAIMSQQQGRTDRETYTGSSREDSIVINDLDFVKNRYFVVNDYDSIIDIRVFIDDDNVTNNDGSQVQSMAFIDADPTQPSVNEQTGWFDELEEAKDYFINREIGILILNKSLPDNYTFAVWCSTAAGEIGNVPFEASYDSSQSATLKLIRPPVEFYKPTDAQFGETWYYQLRNVYDLRARGILPDGFELKVFRKAAGAEERFDQQGEMTFLRLMGLDLEGQVPGEPPDDLIDIEYRGRGNRITEKPGVPAGAGLPYYPTIMVDYEAGLLYFPDLRPFDPAYSHQLPGVDDATLEETNPVLYDNHDPRTTDSKYEIQVKYRTSQASFSLNRSNILEGSEVVKLNGRTLTRGTDYRIIYEIGQIEFLNDEAFDPDAKISIDFEYAPFLSQAQKSLAGFAGTYNFSDKTKLSSIWLYKGKKTPYRRPRLGQEPSRIVVGGLSLSTEREPAFLTKMTNWIPGITAREKSRFRVDLESALTLPNPNTKNAVYIDDMEGTEETSSFGITRRQWDPMSIPQTPQSMNELDWAERYDKVRWYNPKNSTTRGDLNPRLSEEERTKFVPVLEVALQDGTVADAGAGDGWGGIMRLVSKTGLDLKERKFFEIWVNDFNLNRGMLHIDMGLIGEDAMWGREEPNGSLDTEDKNLDGVLDDSGSNGATDEDTGLDRLFNAAETGGGGDPAGDDWKYSEDDADNYSKINGTENNGFIDSEDLNGNGTVDEEKSYYRFSFDLGSEEFLAATGVQDGNKNWRLFRIPLVKSVPNQIRTAPTFDKGVKYVRFFFTDLDTTDARFQIYSMEVTGNRWLEAGIQDSNGVILDTTMTDPGEIFAAGVINNKDGEDYDPPPVEIIVERQVPEKEQSLVLTYENLKPGHTGTVFRALFDDEDYTRYEDIELWAKRAEPEADFAPYPEFFYRFGGDSLNFYEVSTTLDSTTSTVWQKIILDLAELTRIKLGEPEIDSLYGREVEVRRDTVVENSTLGPKTYIYSAVGSPSMTKVRRLTFGVHNRSEEEEMTGEIWIDDLRLLNVKGDPGIAGRVGFELGLSDFISLSGDYRKVGKEFRRISGGSGGTSGGEENPRTGSDETETNLTGSIKLGKFLDRVGISMPLTMNRSKSVSLPELQNASDIVLEDPATQKTERKAEGAGLTINRNRKSNSAWLFYTFDSMSLRMSGRRNNTFNPTKIDSTSSVAVDWSYNYSPRFRSDLTVFRSWKVNPLPTSASLSAKRERTESKSVDIRADSKKSVEGRKSNSNFSFAMNPITSESFSTDFSFSSARDHLYGKPLSFLASVNRGLETSRNHSSKLSYTPRFSSLLAWFKPRLSYTTKYTENMPIAQRQVEIDQETGDTLSTRILHNVQNQNTSSVDFGVAVAQIFQQIPGSSLPEPGDTTGGGGFSPMMVLDGIKNAGTRIGDVTTTVSFGRDSRYDRLLGRPGMKYQFGFSEEIDSLLQQRIAGQTQTANRSQDVSARASSSVRLIPSMSMRVSYNTSRKKSDQSRNAKETKSTTWPDVTYSWDGLEGVWVLGNYLKSATIDVGFNQRTEQSGKTLAKIETERVSKRWEPLLQLDMEWKNGIRGSISTDRSQEVSSNFRGGNSEKLSTGSGVTATVSYKVSSRKTVNIPILGKGTKGGSFTATTNFSLDFRYDTSKEEQMRPYRLDAHTRSYSIRPRVTWTWLQNLSGGLELQFGERRNMKNENRSTRTIGASISALFKF